MQDEKNISPPSDSTATADPLASLLSNPELIGKIKTLLQTSAPTSPPVGEAPITSPSDGSPQEQEQSSLPADGASQNSLGALLGNGGIDGLSAILSNPALMEKLPQIMAMLKPILTASEPSAPTQQTMAPIASTDRKASASDERDRLLLALKPFLSQERQEAVDAILRIAKLGVLLKQIK